MRSLLHPEERQLWDFDGVARIDILETINDTTTLYYSKSKSQYSFISARDFLEKKVTFYEGDTIYHFYSASPDHFQPAEEDVVRAHPIAGFHNFRRLEDGTI